MSRYEEKTVDGRILKQMKVAKELTLRPDCGLLVLEKRIQEIITEGVAWLTNFPQITEQNFATFQEDLGIYFKLRSFDKEKVRTINSVTELTKNGLRAQQQTLIIKVACNGALTDNAQGECRQHPVNVGFGPVALPSVDQVAKPGQKASAELVNQLAGKLYKPTQKTAAPSRYDRLDKQPARGYAPVQTKAHRTFVLAVGPTGRTCLWAYGHIHMTYRMFHEEIFGTAVRTFVHEATHKFANTTDKRYFEYDDTDPDDSLSEADAPVNADSYTWLWCNYSNGRDKMWKA
jgi:hypothetical protein